MGDHWSDVAACRGLRPRLFFPMPSEPRGRVRRAEGTARRICSGCPVIAQCLNHALADEDLPGVWGGTTADERVGLRERRYSATSS